MQVLYRTADAKSPTLKVYVDPDSNTFELDREEAERVARRIAAQNGYARVIFGTDTVAEYGNR